MKLIKSKKGFALLAALVVVAISAIGAYAYWTTTGAGTGSASNATSNGTIVLHGIAPTQLYPGGSSSVSFTADNAGASNLFVTTIHLVSVDADAGHPSCVTTDYTMPDVTSNTNVLAGASGQALLGSGTLSYANTAVSQDGCKGATLTLNLTSS
ncbi:MAG: hypothetical protein H0X39_09215 [Actinobacteria bacterium]|nr:hypothetical protein [Actinomycetota bacterium]